MKRASHATETPQVGRSVPRLESWLKVTGRAEYVHNLRLPGMLYGKIFRSSLAHGRIKRIDVSAAQALAGVHRVVTGEDVRQILPEPYYGPAFHDQPILALDKVRYVGEPVAAVLASDPHVAEQAAQLIAAEYEELPAVYDELTAMQPDTLVHEVLRPAGTFADLKHLQGRKGTNVALDYHLRRGDVDKAFTGADRIFEHTFKTQQCLHLPFEPHVALAEPGDERLTIYTSNQTPSFVRIEIARLFSWPENRVRVKVPYLGGGYGSKVYVKLEALVAALAMPVRRKNILRNGRPQASGTVLQDAAIDEVLEALVGRIGWNAPFDRGSATLRRGRGIAIGLKASISPTTSVAMVNVSADGSVYLYKSTVDMGQGADTAF